MNINCERTRNCEKNERDGERAKAKRQEKSSIAIIWITLHYILYFMNVFFAHCSSFDILLARWLLHIFSFSLLFMHFISLFFFLHQYPQYAHVSHVFIIWRSVFSHFGLIFIVVGVCRFELISMQIIELEEFIQFEWVKSSNCLIDEATTTTKTLERRENTSRIIIIINWHYCKIRN